MHSLQGASYCQQQGRQFAAMQFGPDGVNGYTVTFKCLMPNDPALAGYTVTPAPNVVIENRNR
jgi:hypothetical protein